MYLPPLDVKLTATARDMTIKPVQLPSSASDEGVVDESKVQETVIDGTFVRMRTAPLPAHLPSRDWRNAASSARAASAIVKTKISPARICIMAASFKAKPRFNVQLKGGFRLGKRPAAGYCTTGNALAQ